MAIDVDLQSVRGQFPALALKVDGEPVVYLDNPAGTQVSQRVIDRTTEYWRTMNANQGGAFTTSQRSDALIGQVREAAATFLNATSADEIVFGPNMTTLTFAFSVSPWLALVERGVTVRFVDIKVPECTIDMADLQHQLTPRTRLVAVTHASNVVGSIPDLAAVSRAAHAVGAWLWVDAVHYGPHGPIDVRAIDCDFLVCSSYKFFGPHQGILYGRRALLQRLRPYKVRPATDVGPSRWETGTQNHECLAGLLGAFEYLASIGGADRVLRPALELAMDRIRRHERALVARLIDGLEQIPGITIYGITAAAELEHRVPTVSLTWPPHRPEALARWLASHQVFATHGDHYATELITRLKLVDDGGTLRIGIAHYNTASEIDLVLELLAGFRG
ncbi:MAG: aminotransferase class V-fold PLP-dependent enzyme [Chloroflexi bacterium]|nr:MAG: aminotransferase class V-fold PLP-dependent enzyme [Chloroflexota bacterium]